MFKILLDYSYLRALLNRNDEYHEKANTITKLFYKEYTFYIPFHVFCNVMRECDNYDVEIRKEIHFVLNKSARIQFFTNRKCSFDDIDKYLSSDLGLSFDDCITLEFMKSKGIHVIVSFNEAFDCINGINRIYDLDEYNSERLNFFKYEKSIDE